VNWQPFRSAAAAAVLGVAAGAGCGGARGAPVPAGTAAEPAAERLANQARAVAVLQSENERLHEEMAELRRDNARLRELLEAAGTANRPVTHPAPAVR
jgi:hypothetical protein